MVSRTVVAIAVAAVAAAATGQPAVEGLTAPSLAIRAAVWGQVAKPGQYFLRGSPDLFELLSEAGGPSAGADLTRIVLIRERDGTRKRLNVNRIAASGQPFFIVPGDVVIVPESFWSRFTRNLPVVSTLVVVANLVVTVTVLARR